ncbi:hypothetical protein HB999_06135 [Listeria booriae]|uniref:Uncharacterized protein n=1 Tax=Listeria booriae TaxID=1552123 RepID=A0A7X1C103_9LIST|nr:hypothetical protein [Listeria booriae]MBC1317737.1 hypothetical protein [Listeria booriae]MBC1358277.1 hypothetical protein [Listeria booriae]MBC6163039.1 hypothetical protein [Listeria booriae]
MMKSEDLTKIGDSLIKKLPVASLMLILTLMVSLYAMYQFYTASPEFGIRLIIIIVMLISTLGILGGVLTIYIREGFAIGKYLKSIKENEALENEETPTV